MTTNVTILNNGPADVEVKVNGKVKRVLKYGEFHGGYDLCVYPGQTVSVDEVQPPKKEPSA